MFGLSHEVTIKRNDLKLFSEDLNLDVQEHFTCEKEVKHQNSELFDIVSDMPCTPSNPLNELNMV